MTVDSGIDLAVTQQSIGCAIQVIYLFIFLGANERNFIAKNQLQPALSGQESRAARPRLLDKFSNRTHCS